MTRDARIETVEISGQRIRTAIWPGDGNGRPLIFFNGIGANLEVAAPLGEGLTDRDVIAFDVPGTGGSEDPKHLYRPWWLAQLAARLLDHYGYSEVDVLGVSWGGALAQQFTFQYGKRVQRLVLAATSAGWTMVPGKPKSLSKMASPKRYSDPDYMRKNFETLYGEEADQSSHGHTVRMTPPSRKGYLYQMLCMIGWSSLPFLPLLSQPTLILAGDKDSIVPVANAKILNKFIRNARLHVVAGGGHLFIVSRADEILPMIRDFLNEDDAGASRAA